MNFKGLKYYIFFCFLFLFVDVFSQKGIQQAEFFWDKDPGEGKAFAINDSTNWSDQFFANFQIVNTQNPTTGTHKLCIRLKSANGIWGPLYSKVITFKSERNISISAGELFFNNDPGIGNGIPLIAFDGNFNDAIESVISTNIVLPSLSRMNSLGIRLKDEDGVWGPVFKTIFASKPEQRDIKITAAEFYWDTDPGKGNGKQLIVFDGAYDDALETVFKSDSTTLSGKDHILGIRIRDENGIWGDVYKKYVKFGDELRNIRITAGEYFWNNDPGLGLGKALVAFDGAFDDALESVLFSPSMNLKNGPNLFCIRFKDENNVWGVTFKKTFISSQNLRDIKITNGEFFWNSDPGKGKGIPLLAFDGNFNECIETVVNGGYNFLNLTIGNHVFNIRLKDENNEWGPVFKKSLYRGGELLNVNITKAEYFWGIKDPGVGNGIPLLAFDGQFNSSIESVFGNLKFLPDTGLNIFNIRVQDGKGNWGDLYRKSFSLPKAHQVYITSNNDKVSICQGDSIILRAQGVDSFFWAPESSITSKFKNEIWVKPNQNTEYKLYGFKNGKLDSAIFNLIVYNNPILQVNNPTITLGSSAILNVVGADLFAWTQYVQPQNNSNSIVSVAPFQTTTYLVTGINTSTGCKSTIQSLVSVTTPDNLPILNPANQNLQAAEFFWDYDPGLGKGWPIQTIDGNWNEWLENINIAELHLPLTDSIHVFNIRTKDRNGEWGATFKAPIKISLFKQRNFNISTAEYFWNSDPGKGNGKKIIALNSNFNEALKSFLLEDSTFLSLSKLESSFTFNIRVKDENGLWGPLFKKVIFNNSIHRDLKITSGEYFFGDSDPGEGFGIPIIAFDGYFDKSLESLYESDILYKNSGIQLFNIRVRDENGKWGELYRKTVYVGIQVPQNELKYNGRLTFCKGDSVVLYSNFDSSCTYQWYCNNQKIENAKNVSLVVKNSGLHYLVTTKNGYSHLSNSLVVNVKSPVVNSINLIGCSFAEYKSKKYFTSQLVFDTIKSIEGCDSLYNRVNIYINNPNSFSLLEDTIRVCGSSTILTIGNILNAKIKWSTGDSLQKINITKTGWYSIQILYENGCIFNDSSFVILNKTKEVPICLVSVDSITGFNLIAWKKQYNSGIDSFYIYREGSQLNLYEKIGGVHKSQASFFIDSNSNVNQQAYKYKLGVIDTCGNTTINNGFHKTIHLTTNYGVGNVLNLIWNAYEGFDYVSYNIYRGQSVNSIQLLAKVSSSVNSFTDVNPLPNQNYYLVEAVNSNACEINGQGRTITSTISNFAKVVKTGVTEIYETNQLISVYPNPSTGIYTIKTDLKLNIVVTDLLGKIILNKSNINEIDLSNEVSGVYILRLINENSQSVNSLKLIKQ